MDKKTLHELWPDYVLGQLPEEKMEEIASYLEEFPELKAELDEWEPLMDELNSSWVEPSKEMDTGFYEQLSDSMHSEDENSHQRQGKVLQLRPWMMGLAASVLLLFGFFVGKGLGNDNTGETKETLVAVEELKAAEQETNDVRSQLVISLADQSSASKRLEALSEVKKLDNATDKVIQALFKMLNHDPNVNVRLAAVTSLSKYVENPIVREGLVMSITQQESPLVQIALADLMVTLKEQKSIDSMETLLKKPDINEAVKVKLEESIKEII